MKEVREFFQRMAAWLRTEKGQTVIEYVLIIVLASIVLLYAFRGGNLQEGVGDAAAGIANEISANAPAAP